MSLLKTFPEVDTFFKRKKFSNEELMSFLKEIEKTYIKVDLRKAVLNLIKLELLKYEIESDNIDLKPLEKHTPHLTQAIPITSSEISKLKSMYLDEIAEVIDWRVERLLILLKQKKIIKTGSDVLNDVEFRQAKEMIISRLNAVKRMKKSEQPKLKNKKPEKSLSKGSDVYSLIIKHGLGKVIYIRKS